jgi:hypothetical protein
MMLRRALAVAACCVACMLGVRMLGESAAQAQAATRAGAPKTLTLAGAAGQLDAAAATAAHHPHGTLPVPNIRVTPQAGLVSSGASIDRWLTGELTSIGQEKSATRQAHDLRELAASLRRLATPSSAGQANADPTIVASQVLAQRSYRSAGGAAPAPHDSLWEKFIAYLGKLVATIFGGVFRATASAPIVGQVIAVALVLLLGLVIGYAVVRLIRVLGSMHKPRPVDEGSPLPQPRDPDALYQRGLQAASAGRYAEAVALLFQASLSYIDRQGALPLDPSLTPSEYRRAVKRSNEAASPYFDVLAHEFVMAAFAETPVTRHDWSAADAAYAGLRAAMAS